MKKLTSKIFISAITIMFVISCGQYALEKYNCKILDTETMKTIKKIIYIQIPEQLTEPQLKEIAAQMRNENRNYERLFIFYLLPEMEIGFGAWATTHYNTELEISIMGANKAEEEILKNPELPKGEIIGKWYDKTPYMEHSVMIFKTDGKYKMKETYKDGSASEKDLQYSKSNGKSKFVYKND